MTDEVIRKICDRYSKKYNCTYKIQHSKTTPSVYIKFYFGDNERVSIRISNHRKYNCGISSVKPSVKKLENILKKKLNRHSSYRILKILP